MLGLVGSSAEIMCLFACLFLLIERDSRKVLEGADIQKEAVLSFHTRAAGWRY
jgi:hypothetical protein